MCQLLRHAYRHEVVRGFALASLRHHARSVMNPAGFEVRLVVYTCVSLGEFLQGAPYCFACFFLSLNLKKKQKQTRLWGGSLPSPPIGVHMCDPTLPLKSDQLLLSRHHVTIRIHHAPPHGIQEAEDELRKQAQGRS